MLHGCGGRGSEFERIKKGFCFGIQTYLAMFDHCGSDFGLFSQTRVIVLFILTKRLFIFVKILMCSIVMD